MAESWGNAPNSAIKKAIDAHEKLNGKPSF